MYIYTYVYVCIRITICVFSFSIPTTFLRFLISGPQWSALVLGPGHVRPSVSPRVYLRNWLLQRILSPSLGRYSKVEGGYHQTQVLQPGQLYLPSSRNKKSKMEAYRGLFAEDSCQS